MEMAATQGQRGKVEKEGMQSMGTTRPGAASSSSSSSSQCDGPSSVSVDLPLSSVPPDCGDGDRSDDEDSGDVSARLHSAAGATAVAPPRALWLLLLLLLTTLLLLVVSGAAHWSPRLPAADCTDGSASQPNARAQPPPASPSPALSANVPLTAPSQSDAVSALHLERQEERIGCGWGRALSVVDCRANAGPDAVGGYDWRSGRVQGDGPSCAATVRAACDGQRVCALNQTDTWLTYRCVSASLPLPVHPPLASLAVDSPVAVASPLGRTIVVYVFAPSNPLYIENLRYFVAHAVRPEQTIDYVFITNLDGGQEADLPPLPPNARYVRHRNECFDWGSMGWLVRLQWELGEDDPRRIDFDRYSWFVMANPSVRGPMLPAWQDQSSADFRQWWIYPFQHKLLRSADVRAVGCTASLAIAPHIQSYVWLTDRIGWELLQSERSVTGCYQLVWPETVIKSEVGASRLFTRHKYNLAVLMRALADADFRRPQDFNDGFQHDPSMLGVPDYHHRLPMPPLAKYRRRLQLEPLEVVFVKYKHDSPVDRLRALIRYEQTPP